MGTVSNVFDILNREPSTMAIHEDTCRKKIDAIMRNVHTKKRLNAAESELVNETIVLLNTQKRREDYKRHLQFGALANLIHRLYRFDVTECCITCGARDAPLTRSHIGASRPEIISRVIDSFKHVGHATIGEIMTKYLMMHTTEPIAPQCVPCHRKFEMYQREFAQFD